MKKKLAVLAAGICALSLFLTGCSGEISNDYVTITKYKGVEIDKVDADAVSDNDVEAQINSVLQSKSTTTEVTYNAGYVDYKITEMYRLNDAQRATQITRGISNSIVARMNDKRFWHFFDNKTEFNQLFHEQVKREWLNFANATESQFAEFVQGRGDIICKPIDGSSGQGICKCTPEDYKDVQALYERLKAAGIGIVVYVANISSATFGFF